MGTVVSVDDEILATDCPRRSYPAPRRHICSTGRWSLFVKPPSAFANSAPALAPESNVLEPGRKTWKHVMHPFLVLTLRHAIRPLYFCTMPLLIHSPSPVPLVDFVLKNG
jgi:hypothetical protein